MFYMPIICPDFKGTTMLDSLKDRYEMRIKIMLGIEANIVVFDNKATEQFKLTKRLIYLMARQANINYGSKLDTIYVPNGIKMDLPDYYDPHHINYETITLDESLIEVITIYGATIRPSRPLLTDGIKFFNQMDGSLYGQHTTLVVGEGEHFTILGSLP